MTTQGKPLVSICCITYNHEKYIGGAIESFLMQETNFPFEIVIHDDASTDETAEIICSYERQYPDIIKPIYQLENQYSKGKRMNLQFNFPRAKGKYIALCDGDDYWTDTRKLQKQADFLESNPEYVITYHNSTSIDEDGILITAVCNPHLKDYDDEEMVCGAAFIILSTAMFRNINFDYTKKFEKVLNGDVTLWHLLGFHGKGKYLSSIKHSVYRKHSGGIWSSLTPLKQIEEKLRTRYTLREALNEHYATYFKKMDHVINDIIVSGLNQSIASGNINYYTKFLKHIFQDQRNQHFEVIRLHFLDVYNAGKKYLAKRRGDSK